MPQKYILATLTLFVCLANADNSSRAAVIVFANYTDDEVRFSLSSDKGNPRSYTVAKGDVLAVPATRSLEAAFSTGRKLQRDRVHTNALYFFIGKAKAMQLRQFSFSDSAKQPPKAPAEVEEEPADSTGENASKTILKIPVMLLVDQAERNVQSVWEKRLRQRVKSASDILQRCCRVQLEVVEVGTWQSDPRSAQLADMLDDFQKKVAPKKARLAIGFTGVRGGGAVQDHALGCTKGSLHTHILMGEYRLRTEAERLEVLLHELGHYLGACHSPESNSVMRPKLGDGRANLRSFRMGFDPINTLAMNLIAEEIARRPVRSLAAMRSRTRKCLFDLYTTLTRLIPKDPAAAQYLSALGPRPLEAATVRSLPPAVLEDTRAVVAAITAEAKKNPAGAGRSGDALTVHYFQTAAAKCRQLPADRAALCFTLGLALALDRTALLRSLGIAGIPWSKIESEAERRQRLEVLGEPAIQGSVSLLQSFVVSAAVMTLMDGQAVAAAGLQEELLLLQGGDRFRFDDWMASLAGFSFATQLDAAPDLLDEIATSFRVADYVPSPRGLPEPLGREEFNRRYGSMTDERFLGRQDAVRHRLLTLPGYQPRSARKDGK